MKDIEEPLESTSKAEREVHRTQGRAFLPAFEASREPSDSFLSLRDQKHPLYVQKVGDLYSIGMWPECPRKRPASRSSKRLIHASHCHHLGHLVLLYTVFAPLTAEPTVLNAAKPAGWSDACVSEHGVGGGEMEVRTEQQDH